ncbi:MAG: hypothetical protein AAB776_02850 [Patescibacteria group bacterium]
MFDQQTLDQLRGVMKEVIHDEVPPLVRKIVREEVPPIVKEIVQKEISDLMEFQIIPQFNDIHRELAWIKNRMVTKDFLEERLETFRVDLGLRYRAAT